ncbi:MAG: hypothetical protein AB1Z67_08015 [Candidatus Limnocylindrales bacterium]
MRRPIVTTLTVALLLSATPVLAQDEEPATDEATTQRIEDPALGIAVSVPAEWRVSLIEGVRESAVDRDDGTPLMETTVFYANGGDGTWCDADAWLDVPAGSSLEGFAYALVTYMQQNEGPDVAMMVAEEELPVGPSYRIEAFDQATGRIRGLYLFDGPAQADGTFERYLLTCAAREFGEPFWTDVATSIEFSEPVAAEDEARAEDEASAEDKAQGEDETEPAEEAPAEG